MDFYKTRATSRLIDSVVRRDMADFDKALKQGADVTALYDKQRKDTLLHEVLRQGNLEMARKLLDLGAYVNRTNVDGLTPLMTLLDSAVDERTKKRAICFLLNRNAATDVKDNNGKTLLDYAGEEFAGYICTLKNTKQVAAKHVLGR